MVSLRLRLLCSAMRSVLIGSLIVLSAAACGSLPTTASSTTSTSDAPLDTTTTTAPPAAPCLEAGEGFFGDGPLGTTSDGPGDAATVTGVQLSTYEGCERLTIELAATSGAPATSVGPTSAEFVRKHGLVRVHLDGPVDSTTLSDVVFESELVDRVFVVRDSNGSLFVDVHLAAASVARLSEVSGPARIVVDLAPGGTEIRSPERSDFIVVMPLDEPLASPVTITGYGRTFEANVILRARIDSEIVAETFTTSADYVETWGWFELELPTEVAGDVELFIGEDSARDGQEQGVRLEVTVPET